MKLIPESDNIAAVNDSLRLSAVEGVIIGRLEVYSCKMIRDDKTHYKRFCSEAPQTDFEALSPPLTIAGQPRHPGKKCKGMSPKLNLEVVQSVYGEDACLGTSLGTSFSSTTSSIDEEEMEEEQPEDRIVRKTLFQLQSTLDASFYPHYDFSNTKAARFSREPELASLQRSLGQRLNLLSLGQFDAAQETRLWAAVDGAVTLRDCQVYAFTPEAHEDPYACEGCAWALYYLFFNAALKRVLFLTLRQAPHTALHDETREMLEFRMDEDDLDDGF